MSLTLNDIHVARGGRPVLNGITAAPFAAGEFVVLAGPNGAGKSSLLRAIAQTLPYQGNIMFDGADMHAMARAKHADLLGFMPQSLQSVSDLTVLDSLLVAMNAGGRLNTGRADQLMRAEELLARFAITNLASRGLARLSGGQRQTVGLAQALARDPKLVLLDEPTAALDLAMQFRILSELRALAHEGRVVVAVLHDLTQAARWADRIVMLHNGLAAADGAPGDMLTVALLAEVYNVTARVETDSHGYPVIAIDGPHEA